MLYNISSSYLKSQETVLIIHNVQGLSAINIIQKNQAQFIYKDDFELTDKNIRYNILPLWQEYMIDKKYIDQIKTDKSNYYFTVKNKKILQIKSDSLKKYIPTQKLELDYIILSENANMNITDLIKYFDFKKIIFDSSNSFYKIRNWEKECTQNNIKAFDVLDEGAFIEYL